MDTDLMSGYAAYASPLEAAEEAWSQTPPPETAPVESSISITISISYSVSLSWSVTVSY